eukprot:UN33027
MNSKIWTSHRRIVANMFSASRLRKYFETFDTAAKKSLSMLHTRSHSDDQPSILTEVQDFTLGVLGKLLFGYDFPKQKFQEDTRTLFSVIPLYSYTGIFGWILTYFGRTRSEKAIRRVVQKALEGSNTNEVNLCRRLRDNLISEDSKSKMTIKEVQDELLGLFVAGHETTANTICWGMFLLAYNPEMQTKIKQEIKDKLFGGGKTSKEIEYDDLKKCDILLKLLYETMRVIPTLPTLVRSVLDDVVVQDKYKVPKGYYL